MSEALRDIVSTTANHTIDPASASTQELLQVVAAAAIDVLDGQLTHTGRASPSDQRAFPYLSRSLFKPVTAAVEAEGPASCTTTKPDTIDTDTNTANVTDPKMDANPLTTSAPSGISSSQDNTRSHASPLNTSSKPVCHFITRGRSNRTGRRRPETQAHVAQHRSLLESTLHKEETVNWHSSRELRICGRRMANRNHFWEGQLWDEWEEDEDEGYSSI